MSQSTYPKHVCAYCGQTCSSNGLGKNAHYMKHVREGICTKVSQLQSETGQGYYPPTQLWRDLNEDYDAFLKTKRAT